MSKKTNQPVHSISLVQSFLLTCLCIFMSVCLHAQMPGQHISVNGIVKDNNNKPLKGASVSINGTQTGTITDVLNQAFRSRSSCHSIRCCCTIEYIQLKRVCLS